MTTLLFIGDIVGEAGIAHLETCLPQLIAEHRPDFIIANAENSILSQHPGSLGNCGMSPETNTRLFALGVDIITGGNHSWDGPYGVSVHDDPRVIRPLNYAASAPGRGAALVEKDGLRLGVINLVSKTALRGADEPYDAFDRQMTDWSGAVDLVLVDFHGEAVTEKLAFAFAVDGRAAAVLGTHTHVPTLDARVLPGGTAYVTDVGMTGPGGGVQGYLPGFFTQPIRHRFPPNEPLRFAEGAVELGAVLVTIDDGRAVSIARLS